MDISAVLYADGRTTHDVNFLPDIVYATRETGDLTLQLFTPVRPNVPRPQHHALYAKMNRPEPPKETRRFPLIVDAPGSGWSGTTGREDVPKLIEFAKMGFAVASIAYRGTFKDDVRFPAAVQDMKEAVRFLRANADTYCIDAERVALLGSSSGGHTAAMAALTGDEPRFNIGGHLDQTAAVKACVIYYGPNDLPNLVPDRVAEGKRLRPGEGDYPFEAREIFKDDFLADPEAMLADASPIRYIEKGKAMPRFLFLNGDDDPIIPLRQGIRFCNKVRECGGRAEFVKIAGGGHGVGCHTPEATELIGKFLIASV